MSSSIVRQPSFGQIRSYSRRASSSVRMRLPVDAQMPEVVETGGNGAAGLSQRHVQIHAQARDGRLLHRGGGVARKRRQALLRGDVLSGQELAFRPVYLQSEGEFMPPLPAVL